MGAEKVLTPPIEQVDRIKKKPIGGKTRPNERTFQTEKYSKLYNAFDVFVAVWTVISEWMRDCTARGFKAFVRTCRALWSAIWIGRIFPLKVTISYGDEVKVMRSVFVGRLVAVTLVSLAHGIRIALIKHKAYVPFVILSIIWLISGSGLVLKGMTWGFVAILPYFTVLGCWRAREYRGLKLFLSGRLDRASSDEETKVE